jgi:3-mercaptopyruvate sulfurtransferase SseA
MKFNLPAIAVFTIAFGILTACQNASQKSSVEKAKTNTNSVQKPSEHGQMADASRISLEDAKNDFDAGNVVFIDTRGADTFKEEHIKGAINIMPEQVELKYKEIPTGKKLIVYCS